MAVREWTPDEERTLRQNYEEMTNVELAEKLKVSPKTISKKLADLGLERTGRPVKAAAAVKAVKAAAGKMHQNVQCRQCLMVDGYLDSEDTCRYCRARLFKGDVL